MTCQLKDYLTYKGKIYELIDCSCEDNLLEHVKTCISDGNYYTGTDCHRGYLAEYRICNDILYGAKTDCFLIEEVKTLVRIPRRCKEELKVNYTGKVLIAHRKETVHALKKLHSNIPYDNVLELLFIEGELCEINEVDVCSISAKQNIQEYGNHYYADF